MNTFEIVQDLASRGLSVVPIAHETKRPSIEWKAFQTRHATDKELETWFQHRNIGCGVVCGEVSGNLVCLDFDTPGSFEAFAKLPENQALIEKAPIARTSRGHHLFFRSVNPVKSSALYVEGFDGKAGDILAEGKVVVLPPTVHPDGTVRQWERPFSGGIPTISFDSIRLGSALREAAVPGKKVAEGLRHAFLMKTGAILRSKGCEFEALNQMLSHANYEQCEPPLPSHEVMGIAMFLASKPVSSQSHHPLGTVNHDDEIDQTPIIITSSNCLEDEDSGQTKYGDMFIEGKSYMEKRNEEPMEWLIEDLLPLSYLAVVGATSKCGKSCFITNMADAVTHGTPFLGKKTLKCPILWVACEESEAERAMVLSLYPDVSNNYLLTHQRVSLDSPESIKALRWWVRKSKAKLIVIDPLYGAIDMQSISKGVEGRSSLKDLKELCRVENVSAVVLHHTNKNVSVGMTRERFADSGQILAVASTDWLIEARIRPDGTRDLMMSTTGRGAFANKRLLIHSPSLTEYELVAEGTGDSVFTEDRHDDLISELQKHQNGLTAFELAQTLRLQPRTTQNRLTQLLRLKEIVVLEKRGKASVYGAAQEELGLVEEG